MSGKPKSPVLEDPQFPPVEPAPLHVVGVGASAGGLESLLKLLAGVPLDNTAFVIVQHLSPDHPSSLAALLSRETSLSVHTASEDVALEPNNIYVMPHHASVTIQGAMLRMGSAEQARTRRNPVDNLLTSLAFAQGARALGVVLSGTGRDGTAGMRAIKEAGGLTFVEEPATAGHGGMPQSVIDAGYADFVLTPTEIAREITNFLNSSSAEADLAPRPPDEARAMQRIFATIKTQFGTDLADYKIATLERRIARRMAICKSTTLHAYADQLGSNRSELQELYRDLLISVTSFFRDPQAYEGLQREVVDAIVKRHGRTERPIRVWVVGCATGEEAYSVAICFSEALESANSEASIQIFATDLADGAINVARRGIYSAAIADDMSAARLKRFFVKKGKNYQVCRPIRDMVVLSRHNLLKDAPFSRIDLVTCRNVLIYLGSGAQKRALRVLHYALAPHGVLMLGASETIGDSIELFKLRDRKGKFYAKNMVHTEVTGVGPYKSSLPDPERRIETTRRATPLQALAEKCLLDDFCPPGVIVNEQLDIVHFHGHTGNYLDPIPGAASFNILRLARRELTIPIKRLASEVLQGGRHRDMDTRFKLGGKRYDVCVHVTQLPSDESTQCYLLILFEPLFVSKGPEPRAKDRPADSVGLVKQLQEVRGELELTKDYLRTTLEEKESAIEELQAANEELQSANEELQSTNEELETSKEELQSANEELTTVNDELCNRMLELNQINDDYYNVQASVSNAIVLVGLDLRIRRSTAAAERFFNMVPSDTGREVTCLTKSLNIDDLTEKISKVITTLEIYEVDVQDPEGHWWAMRISPYRTQDHSIRGAVVSMSNIDLKKHNEAFSQDIAAFADRLYGSLQVPMALLDKELKVRWLNQYFTEAMGIDASQILNHEQNFLNRDSPLDENFRNIMSGALSTGKSFSEYKFVHSDGAGNKRKFTVNGGLLPELLQERLLMIALSAAPEE